MHKTVKRCLSFLLVLVLAFGMLPTAYAAEVTEPDVTLPEPTTNETVPVETESTPTEETQPETPDATGPPEETEAMEETEATEVAPVEIPEMSANPYAVSTLAASTQSGISLFDFSDNGDYTTRLKSQIYVTYKPNGTGSAKTAGIQNLGWHFARYGGVPYADDPLYCIEPYRTYGASTSGHSVDRDVTVSGSGSSTGTNVWYALPEARREAIGLILLYSNQMWDDSVSVFDVKRDSNPNVPLRIATQFLIYEIVCGLRNPTTFVLNSTNESGTAGNIFYNAGVASVSNFAPNYNSLVSSIQAAKKIPSFTASSRANAPTITMNGKEASAYDNNGVLSSFRISDGSGASFSKSGNTLYITQTGTISESTVFSLSRSVPSAYNSGFNIWYMSGSTYQTCINLYSASSGTVNGYFKLKAPSEGSLGLTKTTEDGKNLSGWKFGIYSDSACQSLVSGPHTTDASGKINVSSISAGTYYVKELGHTDSAIESMYVCASTNPQKVTISSGSTATVTFRNNLIPGSLGLTKTTEDGKNLSGWEFGIYSDSGCQSLVSGPHTTDATGKINVSGIAAGTYYVKELGHTDSAIESMYVCASTNPQKVTISSGSTATVTFRNNLATGSLSLVKTTNTGENLAGWQINLYTDADCTALVDGSPFLTGQDGTVQITGLNPGTYYAKEIASTDPYWECDPEVKSVQLKSGETATMTFSNTHYGCIKIQKTTNTGKDLEGWVFRVTDPDGKPVGDFTTDKEGAILLEKLLPGRYMVQELPVDDDYWATEFGWHDVIVEAGDIVLDTWLNKDQGLGWFHKQTNTGDDLVGWEITIYSDEDCTDVVRTVVTNEDGKVGYYMDPGIYYAKETGDSFGRFEDPFWNCDTEVKKFEIKCHEDTAVYFTNNYHGSLKIIKTMEDGSDPQGWQFKITDSEGKELDGSPFTTGTDGMILTGAIAPGEYTVEEIIPEDSAYYCKSENPQKVTVVQGETAEVSFTNALRPGKITLEKVNTKGQHLADATFLLEYSEDGHLWWPIEYSDSEKPVGGGCSNPNVKDGCLTTGEDGIIEWDNLLPGMYYRVKEVKAPDGYNILKKVAYEDQLTTEDLHITIRVINTRVFNLPDTGSNDLLLVPMIGMLFMSLGLVVIYSRKRRV